MTKLIRPNPLNGLRLFDRDAFDILNDMDRWFAPLTTPPDDALGFRVDVTRSEGGIKVRADLPGLNKEDIKVELQDNLLTISGEKKEEVETKENGYLRQERHYGTFTRRFTVPEGVDESKIHATYKDGVLTLEIPLPKAVPAGEKVRKIKVD